MRLLSKEPSLSMLPLELNIVCSDEFTAQGFGGGATSGTKSS